MAWAFVQLGQGGQNSGYPIGIGMTVTVGDTILVMLGHSYIPCPPSVSDSLGNTYTKVVNGAQNTSTRAAYAFWAPVTVGGANTITISAACGVTRVGSYVVEYSGLDNTGPFDDHHSQNAGTTTYSTGTLTTTAANDLLVSFFNGADPMGGGSGTVRYNPGANQYYQDENVPAAGSVAATVSGASPGSDNFGFAWKQAATAAGFIAQKPFTKLQAVNRASTF